VKFSDNGWQHAFGLAAVENRNIMSGVNQITDNVRADKTSSANY
jgi:hypothetical protein